MLNVSCYIFIASPSGLPMGWVLVTLDSLDVNQWKHKPSASCVSPVVLIDSCS